MTTPTGIRFYRDTMDRITAAGTKDDSETVGAYALLLVGAVRFYPDSAPLPRQVTAPSLDRLVALDLVVVEGDWYRIPEVDRDLATGEEYP